jgi:phage anti-repressor protein
MELVNQALIKFNYQEIQPRDLAKLSGFTDDEMKKIDLYWDPVFNDSWIYLSPELITEDMGYKSTYAFYRDNLRKDYKENIDYKKVSKTHKIVVDFYQRSVSDRKNPGNKAVYYLITGITIKKMLMNAETKRGRETRDYYIKVESLAMLMSRYLCELHIHLSKQKEIKIQEQNALINNANIKNKELLTFKLMIEKNETVYIMSSKSYAKQGLWKIGRTKQKVTSRLASINTACPAGEAIHVLKEIKTHSAMELEKRCHWILRNLRPTYTREWFLSSWCRLTKLLDIIAENMDKEIEIVNELIKEVHSIDGSGETQYIAGLDLDIFEPKPREIIDLTHSTDSTISKQSIDITGLNPLQKKEKLIEAVNKFVRSNFENMEKFDYNTDKDSDAVTIPLIWPNILINLMHICKIQKKTNIKANLWKPTLREMIAESSCLDAVKWR